MSVALFELPGGYSLFRVEGKSIQLIAFQKFKDAAQALEASSALQSGDLHVSLKKFLKKHIQDAELKATLSIADVKLAQVVQKKMGITCTAGEQVDEVMRQIREKLTTLVEGLTDANLKQMSLGLAHTLNRHILKFSAEKLDIMIIQAVGLLDDLDKELNTYAMRVKEWYGWHFPEMQKVVQDNIQYARVVLKMGPKEKAATTELTDVVPEETQDQIRQAAITSMGVGLTKSDLKHIKMLATEVIATSEYRAQLAEYLKSRMTAMAPNLTAMVGELIGARLIAQAGSLLNLAKAPASTLQLLGAEKALFRAMKKKEKTPKYGILYHVSVIGQTSAKMRGKMARAVATNSSLAARVDALSEGKLEGPTIGATGLAKVEKRKREIETKGERDAKRQRTE